MSIARHHADWLSLVEVSGPFLSLPVLMRALPSGLAKAADESEVMRRLRLAHEEWEDSLEMARPDPAIHNAWIIFVLHEVLELTAEVLVEGQAIPQTLHASSPEHGETLRPNLVLVTPKGRSDADKVRLLIQTYPADQDLEKPVSSKPWKISPATRMMELCHAAGVRLGLVTNGDEWMLVDAPRNDTTGFVSWFVQDWFDFPDAFRAFRSLLGVERFFNVPDPDTLESLLKESADHQLEVTEQLGYQVRNAVEMLIQALDKADQEHSRALLADVSEAELYEAALNVMMRLVFLFCAEERGLLLLGDPIYNENYAVSTLRENLREAADQHGEEILERRHDAWCRLLSTFRAVHGGVEHERMTIPPYAGHLFDPDRFPFLEGRKRGTEWRQTPADPLPVDNRTVLHLLEALQLLQVRVPGGGPAEARRVSFRALDIEQIGHVYEGLLDHTARRATEPVLGLAGTRDKEPENLLSKLEALKEEGDDKLLDFLKEETGRSLSALRNALAAEIESDLASRFHVACGNDEKLWNRVRPFAGLVRLDSYGYPVVIPKGSVYVTAGTERRSSGTFYTPRSLTTPIVQYTLEPLVYEGPAEGKPNAEWELRSAKALLDLKICDMACGSGAFLVQACRYLSELVVESWERAEKSQPGNLRITPYGESSEGLPEEQLVPKDVDERMIAARRIVAQRCLYGVDVNPLAVEMAKLSLWLLTLAKDRPFTFLDHAIRCGDSLVGISDTKQLERFSLDGDGLEMPLLQDQIKKRLEATRLLRKQIAEIPDASPHDVERKELMFKNAEEHTARLRYAADMLVAASWKPLSENERTEDLKQMLLHVEHRFRDLSAPELTDEAGRHLADVGCKRTFHWPLEFPEVFLQGGGFTTFICNPPFMGGRLIGRSLGGNYHDYIARIRNYVKGSPDLCAYFFLRAHCLLRESGAFGFLATKTISETGTRSVCLDKIIEAGSRIYRAIPRRPWPGIAAVFVAHVHVYKGKWSGQSVLGLDEQEVETINGGLEEENILGVAHKLLALKGKFSQGQDLLGQGFELTAGERDTLLAEDPKSDEVIFPLYNGQDFNTMPELVPYRWAIYFGDQPEKIARTFPGAFQRVRRLVQPYRDSLTGQIHQECFWKFWDLRPRLMKEVATHEFILASPIVTKYVSFLRVPTSNIYNHQTKLYFWYDWRYFGVLQSSVHQEWAHWRCGTMGGKTFRYSTSAALDTWPMPTGFDAPSFGALDSVSEDYHSLRAQVMRKCGEGLTGLYNGFHDPDEAGALLQLRELHVEMDTRVADAYGWGDIGLDHGFHETKQGIRFTISESARREVLARLLKLNHERYCAEVKQGFHDKIKGKTKQPTKAQGRKKVASRPTLFDSDDDDEGG